MKARVMDGKNQIEFEGEQLSVSSVANKILGKNNTVSGYVYWKYNDGEYDELLVEKRIRIEAETEDEAE